MSFSYLIEMNLKHFHWLTQIADENALPELTSPVSGVILTLLAHLRQSTIPTAPLSTSGVDSTGAGRPVHPQAGSSLPVGPSVAILKGLIETVLRCGGGLQRVRANLYAALLYFMQTAPEPESTEERGNFAGLSLSQLSKTLRFTNN